MNRFYFLAAFWGFCLFDDAYYYCTSTAHWMRVFDLCLCMIAVAMSLLNLKKAIKSRAPSASASLDEYLDTIITLTKENTLKDEVMKSQKEQIESLQKEIEALRLINQ